MENLQIEIVRYFDDNYSYLIRCNQSNKTALVDCGDAGPILDYLEKKTWNLDYAFVTHAHYDHAGDISGLLKSFPEATFVKPAGETRLTIPGIEVGDGDIVCFGEHTIKAISVPAHTRYCTCYFIEGNLFVGDALFSAGCGRLFEGQASDLEKAMDKLASFPDDTNVFVGHEYTLANLRFAISMEPANHDSKEYLQESLNKLDKTGITTPTTIGKEKSINPFLRIDQKSIIQNLDPNHSMTRTRRIELLRSKKDSF